MQSQFLVGLETLIHLKILYQKFHHLQRWAEKQLQAKATRIIVFSNHQN